MSDNASPPGLSRATTRRSRRVSIVWVIPLVAVAIGAYLAWDTLSKKGPTITISFQSAEGLEAGKSQLKYRDIVFGTVQGFTLSDDMSRVQVKVETTREAEPLLNDQAVFWVVKPRLFAGNISGLETLLSGSYIAILPRSGGKPQRSFVGQEEPPVLEAHVPGHTFLLKASRIGSISLGSPVFYRDIEVGEVLGWDLGEMAENVTIRAFVRAPFDSYVHDESRFWDASGISVKLAGAGIDVQVESLKAILIGGIAFSTPSLQRAGPVSAENHVFPLFADRSAADAASYRRKIPVISYFKGSVRGLGPGSDVTMHGLTVGQVLDVRLVYDPVKEEVLAPVRYEVEPERILGVGADAVFKTTDEGATAVSKRGLNASLESANLITGQQMVALDFDPKQARETFTKQGEDYVLPTTEGGGFASLTASANELLNQVNQIPFKEIGQRLEGILKSADDTMESPEMKKTLRDLAGTMASADDLVHRLDTRQLPQLVSSLEETLNNANKLMVSIDKGYGDNTKFERDLERLMAQADEALNSIRSLADLLSRHPEALIKGRPAGGVE